MKTRSKAFRLLLSEAESEESGLDSVLGLFSSSEEERRSRAYSKISSESSEFWEQVLERTCRDPLATCRNILGGSGSDMSIQLSRVLESALDEDPKIFGGKEGLELIKSLSVWIGVGRGNSSTTTAESTHALRRLRNIFTID